MLLIYHKKRINDDKTLLFAVFFIKSKIAVYRMQSVVPHIYMCGRRRLSQNNYEA
jgi:hypothetical protein